MNINLFAFCSFAFVLIKGGLPFYVATRGLYKMEPPTIILPKSILNDVENLLEVHRRLDQSELKCNLIGLDVGNVPY